MSDLGPHAAFIVSAYVIAALAVLGLVGWIILDGRLQARRLAELEARGIRRRTGSGTGTGRNASH
jgi:heme exporter protein D